MQPADSVTMYLRVRRFGRGQRDRKKDRPEQATAPRARNGRLTVDEPTDLRGRRTVAWLVSRQLDALAIVAVLFAVAPTHCLSAHVNVARIERGAIAPLLHLRAQARRPRARATTGRDRVAPHG